VIGFATSGSADAIALVLALASHLNVNKMDRENARQRVENWLAAGIAVMLIMVPPCRRVFGRELFLLDQRLQTTRTHSLDEGFVVPLALVGIGDRELGNRLVKSVAFAKVAGDQCRFSGAGVSAG
jgi:hypothetical protein